MIDLNIVKELAQVSVGKRTPDQTRTYYFVPDGDGKFRKEEIPALFELPLPDHIRQRVSLDERESFTGYVTKFKGPNSQIFGQVTEVGADFSCILDYHESGNERTPGRLKHVAAFEPDYSPEFAAWLKLHRTGISQEAFLDHLRRWGYTVTNFTDADMIEMFSNLDFTVKGEFSSKIERTKGGRKLTFNETVDGNTSQQAKTIPVPDLLNVRSEIFVGGKVFDYGADVLYRVQSGKLTIAIELKRHHVVVKDAIKSLITDIEAETGLKVLIGSTDTE